MDNFYKNLSRRRRRELEQFIPELGMIADVQHQATPEFPLLLESTREYEGEWMRQRTNAPQLYRAQFFAEQPGFTRDWTDGFFTALDEWCLEVRDYRDAVSKYENFRQSLPVLPKNFSRRATVEGLSLEETLLALQKEGYDAALFGAVEAHYQLRCLAQLFFARYSAETRLDGAHLPKPQGKPRPNLAAYIHKRTQRAVLMKQPQATPDGWTIDPSAFLALYIDRLDDGRCALQSWQTKTRTLYLDGTLLLPGFPEIDALLGKVKRSYGDFTTARSRLTQESTDLRSYAAQDAVNFRKFGQLDRSLADIADQRSAVELRMQLSLCLMGVAQGRTHAAYYGPEEQWLLHSILRYTSLPAIDDLYSQGEIDWDWKSVLTAWKREATEAERRKPAIRTRTPALEPATPAKPPLALAPITLTEKEIEKARKKEKKKRLQAEKRGATAEARALRKTEREIARHAEQRKEREAAKKGTQTRKNNLLESRERTEAQRKQQEEIRRAAEEASKRQPSKPHPAKPQIAKPKKKKARKRKGWDEHRRLMIKAIREARRPQNMLPKALKPG